MHLRGPILHFLHNRELDELFATIAIRGFAASMIGIFIPIYLLTLGYSLKAVLIFFIIRQVVYALASFPTALLDARFGFKHAILISMPFFIAFLSMLATLETMAWPLWILAVLSGIQLAIFWTSYHTDFALVADGKDMGKEVGFVKFISKASNVVGPLLGGFLIVLIGFTNVLIVVNILLLVSVVPLFFSKDTHSKSTLSIKKTFTGKGWKDYLALAAYGMESSVASVIWPVFIFFYIVSDFTTVGLITTVSLSFSLIAVIVAAGLADKHYNFTIRFGAITHTIIWGLKAFVTSAGQVFFADSFHGSSRSMLAVPFDAKMYKKAGRGDTLQYVLFRATAVSIGSTALFVAMIFIADLTSSFWMAGAASLIFLLY
jgi:hypothetical protein